MMVPRLILPLPPSDNHSHQITAHWDRDAVKAAVITQGPLPKAQIHRYRTPATKAYMEAAGWSAKVWMHHRGWELPPPHTKVRLYYWVFWPDARRRDPANLLKILHDSLKGIVVPDDNQLLPWAMDYQIDRQRPRIEVQLRRLESKRSTAVRAVP